MGETTEWVCFLEPSRAGMPSGPTAEEAAAVGEHFAYYQRLLGEGVLVLAGRTQEPPFVGLFVFRAKDRPAAEAIVAADPGVARGVFRARVQPYTVALLGTAGATPPHRRLAAELFNRVWTLLDTPDRTPEQDDEMVHAAHASAYHWLQAGGLLEHARSHWQCARVYSTLRRGEAALHHALRCLALCEQHGLGPFDTTCAHEAIARALVALDRRDEARDSLARAEAALGEITDAEDRSIAQQDIEQTRRAVG
jgi:uncharacterized protein YciI